MHTHSLRLIAVFFAFTSLISYSTQQDPDINFGTATIDPNDDYQGSFSTSGSDDLIDDSLLDSDDDMDFNMEDFNMEDFFSKGIMDFNGEAFQEAVSDNGIVLVLIMNDKYPEDNKEYEVFFKSLAPYLSSEVLGADVTLGRLMIEEAPELNDYYKPKQYPALMLFDHVRKFEYEDELELVEFFTWFTQTISREPIELQNQDDFDRFLQSDNGPKLVAFYNSRDNQELEALNEIATRSFLTHFDIRKVGLCLEYCSANYKDFSFNRPALVLFKNYESSKPYSILSTNLDNAEAVFAFANLESLPPVLIYDQINQTKMFGEIIKNQLTLIVDPEVDNSRIIKEFYENANQNRENESPNNRILHIVYNFDKNEEGLNWFFNLHDNSNLPKLFLMHTSETLDKITKYQYKKTDTITLDTIKQFIKDFQNDKLERFYISEDIPDNTGKVSNKLVGYTFEKEVFESSDNYAVLACPEMDKPQCSTALNNFETAISHLGSRPANFKFGYIDLLKNEADVEPAEEFPIILLYKFSKKDEPSVYSGPFTEDGLKAWIKNTVTELETSTRTSQGSSYTSEL